MPCPQPLKNGSIITYSLAAFFMVSEIRRCELRVYFITLGRRATLMFDNLHFVFLLISESMVSAYRLLKLTCYWDYFMRYYII